MKTYLADTHAIVWFIGGERRRLGRRARRVFDEQAADRCEIRVSVISLWEIALLHDAGALHLPAGFSAWCDALEGLARFSIEPMLRSDVELARSLAGLRDPSDRLIAGTALRLGAALITADARIRDDSRIPTVW
jgi:PIN domain nuclease of toxin-antitoxin system